MARIDASAFRYLIVGAANTLVGLLVIYFGMYVVKLSNIAANALGYGAGMILGFVLNKHWTFNHQGPVVPAIAKFMTVVAIAYAANLITVLLSADYMQLNSYLAQALGIIPYTLIGYTGSRFFAFRGRQA